MGTFSRFYRKEKISGYNSDIHIERDELVSEFPILTLGQGFFYPATGASISHQSMSFQVPSGKLFHLKDMYIVPLGGPPSAPVVFFDGPGVSAPKYLWMGSGSFGEHLTDIVGAVFQSIPYISTSLSMVWVKFGGLIRDKVSES